MSAFKQVIRIVLFPFRAAWFIVLIVNFVLISAVCVFIAALVAYGLALAFSYAFLQPEWTRALWHWAADLYDHSPWFRAATITLFVLAILPVLQFWPGTDGLGDAARRSESDRLNDDLIAARRQQELRAKLRA